LITIKHFFSITTKANSLNINYNRTMIQGKVFKHLPVSHVSETK